MKKIGRPSLGDAARRNTITCMVTDAERFAVNAAAREAGLTLAEYLRSRALEPVVAAGPVRGDATPSIRRSA